MLKMYLKVTLGKGFLVTFNKVFIPCKVARSTLTSVRDIYWIINVYYDNWQVSDNTSMIYRKRMLKSTHGLYKFWDMRKIKVNYKV